MFRVGKNLDKYSTKFLSRRKVFLMDLAISTVVSVVVAIIAFLLDVEDVFSRSFDIIWGVSALVGSALMFFLLKTNAIIIRHFSFKDSFLFGAASFGKAVLMAIALFFSRCLTPEVIVMLIVDASLSMVALCSVRLLMIYVFDAYKARVRELERRSRVMIYGVNDKAVATATRLRGAKRYEVVGLISNNHQIKDTLIADQRVYCFDEAKSFEAEVRRMSLRGVIFTAERDVVAEQDKIVRYCSELGIKVLIAPAVDEVTGNPAEHLRIRNIRIEDLLGRDEIQISLDAIKANFRDKVVLVTGCAGSIGSELCRQLAGFGIRRLVLYDNAETPMHNLRLELEEHFPELDFVPIIGDVRQPPRLDFAFRTHHPQVVFHAAAYKHVPLMEENPCEAVLVNVFGTRNVADKCIEYGVEKMVMISTDKAVNPTNIMGCTKRLAEIYVQSLGKEIASGKLAGKTQFVTTRFGNVLGSNGSVIPRFREQIEHGGPVTVTDPNITRYFMTIPEACRLVMEAATLPTENRICVFDMGKPVKIDTLARRMIELAGLVPGQDIEIIYTGLRPGEKLYEEVLSNKENTEKTSHDRIRIARVREYDYADAVKAVSELETLARAVQIPDMVRLMKEVVPEYISNNSRFEEFDKK
ncbi:MAG: polysaccharide biosynthesis protein [Bacteroidales bacterium]|nr:polysaccharide biosynthesis protein [Bacteroidales bacterium]